MPEKAVEREQGPNTEKEPGPLRGCASSQWPALVRWLHDTPKEFRSWVLCSQPLERFPRFGGLQSPGRSEPRHSAGQDSLPEALELCKTCHLCKVLGGSPIND